MTNSNDYGVALELVEYYGDKAPLYDIGGTDLIKQALTIAKDVADGKYVKKESEE